MAPGKNGWLGDDPFILGPGLVSGAILVSGRVSFRFEISLKMFVFRSFGFFLKLVPNDVESDMCFKKISHFINPNPELVGGFLPPI